MTSKPMISVAGIRAIVGESLQPETFLRYVMAFGTMCKGGRIVVGSDTRLSRHMVRNLVHAGLTAVGCQVVEIGLVATPTVGLTVRRLNAAGGIAITASHNPAEWNALKFFGPTGTFLTPEANKTLLKIESEGAFHLASFQQLGAVELLDDAIDFHIRVVLEQVDNFAIRSRGFRASIDSVNGVGHLMLSPLMDRLGVQSDWIHATIDHPFAHNPEPLPENLGNLSSSVREHHSNLGFAVDPDADRLALVDETGRAIGEERTLPLVARCLLQSGLRGPLVVNLSTSQAIDHVAQEFNVPVYRTPIGEAHVVGKIDEVKALLGGEGNGGVIFPRIHPGRDAATGVALILHALAKAPEGTTLSQLNAQIPDFAMIKTKHSIDGMDFAALVARLEKIFPDKTSVNLEDGFKATLAKSWVHIRPSGTEPVVRIFAEAPDKDQAQALVDRVANALG